MNQKFVVHDGARISEEEIAIVGKVLTALSKRLSRPLQPSDVVAEAKRKSSPLHSLKCSPSWNLRKAAEEHWLDWGRYVLRSVDIVIESSGDGSGQRTRAFPHIVTETSNGYVPMEDVRSNVNYRESLIAQAKRELEIWTDRYAALCKVFPKVFAAVRAVTAKKVTLKRNSRKKAA